MLGNANFTGTVTSDGLTVDGDGTLQSNASSSVPTLTLKDTDTSISVGQSLGRLSFSSADASPDAAGERAYVRGYLIDGTNYGIDIGAMASGGSPTKRLTVSGSGDISFYEDTGTTAKLFWDASAESLGIGTTSPATALDVSGGLNSSHATFSGQAGRGLVISTENTLSNDDGVSYNAQTSSGKHLFKTNGTERMRIDSSGNVGIGTTSPSAKLDIFDSGAGNANSAAIELTNYDYGIGETGQSVSIESLVRNDGGGTSTTGKIVFGKDSDYSSAANRDGNIQFYTNQSNSVTEAMRIDSSGNVGIGTSSPSSYYSAGNQLVIGDSGGNRGLTIASSTGGTGNIYFADGTTGAQAYEGVIQYNHSSNVLDFFTNTGTLGAASPVMRIDASGNLLVGRTGTAFGSETGVHLSPDGYIHQERNFAGTGS